MFEAKTGRIRELAEKYPDRIKELEIIFDKKTNIYIDFANDVSSIPQNSPEILKIS